MIAVVKADAYGHGATTVARALEGMGVDALAVAIIDEAVALRKEGIGSPIIVFGGALPGEEAATLHYDLLPAVHSIEALVRLSQSAKSLGMEVGYHLKVDTGMGRVGIDYATGTSVCSSTTRWSFPRLGWRVCLHISPPPTKTPATTRLCS